MIVIYILIGIVVGAVLLYLLMDRRLDAQRHEERFKNMAQQLLEQSAQKLKKSNTETISGITHPRSPSFCGICNPAEPNMGICNPRKVCPFKSVLFFAPKRSSYARLLPKGRKKRTDIRG